METININISPDAKCCSRCKKKDTGCEYRSQGIAKLCPYVDCYTDGYIQAEEDLIVRLENRIEILRKINSHKNGETISHLDAIISEIKTQIKVQEK